MVVLNTLKRVLGWLTVILSTLSTFIYSVDLYHISPVRVQAASELKQGLLISVVVLLVGFFLTDIWKKKSLK